MNLVIRLLARNHAQALCLVLLVAACSKAAQTAPATGESAEPVTTPLSLTAADSGRALTAKPNQEFSITLQTIGGGSYGTPEVSSDAVRFLGDAPPDAQNPGGPRQVLRFQAVKPGEAEITVPHSERPEPFRVKISVQ
ncbi:MAG: hypothetical protein ACOY0T_30525 [Myxococcota bacterium]